MSISNDGFVLVVMVMFVFDNECVRFCGEGVELKELCIELFSWDLVVSLCGEG